MLFIALINFVHWHYFGWVNNVSSNVFSLEVTIDIVEIRTVEIILINRELISVCGIKVNKQINYSSYTLSVCRPIKWVLSEVNKSITLSSYFIGLSKHIKKETSKSIIIIFETFISFNPFWLHLARPFITIIHGVSIRVTPQLSQEHQPSFPIIIRCGIIDSHFIKLVKHNWHTCVTRLSQWIILLKLDSFNECLNNIIIIWSGVDTTCNNVTLIDFFSLSGITLQNYGHDACYH
jgi:hypothetical protein